MYDHPEYTRGWSEATASFQEIWEEIKKEYPKPEDRVSEVDFFLVLTELRLNGASWEEIAVVAELNGKNQLAADARAVNEESK